MRIRLDEAMTGRANNIDFLRFALASLVILSHSYPLAARPGAVEPVEWATGGQKTGGELAVDAFFILSGILIARSWVNSRGLADYLRRRVLRIYPGFAVAVLFCILVAGPLLAPPTFDYWASFRWSEVLLNLPNLNFAHPRNFPGQLNGSLWSIRYEFLCYLTVAFLGTTGLLARRSFVLIGWIGCLGLFAAQNWLGMKMPGSGLTWLWCYPEWWPRLMADFLGGAVLYLYRDRLTLTTPGAIAAAGLLVAGAVGWTSLRTLPLLVPTVGVYLLAVLAYWPVRRLEGFARRGDISYGMYLYGFPCQMLLLALLPAHPEPLLLFLLAMPTTAILAVLSWLLVESPCLKWKAFGRRPVAPPREAASGLPVVAAPAAKA